MTHNTDDHTEKFDALKELAELDAKYGDVTVGGYQLKMTSSACPEQYDVLDSHGEMVGYLRLRHGHFRADVPDCGGETVYEAEPEGDGLFAEHERARYLAEAVAAIHRYLEQEAGSDGVRVSD